jgi:ribosome recycling factor
MITHSFLLSLLKETAKQSRIQTPYFFAKHRKSNMLLPVGYSCNVLREDRAARIQRYDGLAICCRLWTTSRCWPLASSRYFLARSAQKHRGGRQKNEGRIEEEEENAEDVDEEEQTASRTKNKKRSSNKKKDAKDIDDEDTESSFDMRDIETKFAKTVQWTTQKLATIRMGRADPSLLDHIRYKDQPLKNFAVITVRDPLTLSVSPFDPNLISDLQKAIQVGKPDDDADSQERSSPSTSSSSSSSATTFFRFSAHIEGRTILVSIPKPTREYRESLLKLAKGVLEEAKLSVRNTRKAALAGLKKMKLPEDEEKQKEKDIQKRHDDTLKKLDQLFAQKQKEITA